MPPPPPASATAAAPPLLSPSPTPAAPSATGRLFDLERFGQAAAVIDAAGVHTYAKLARRADELGARLGRGRRLVAIEASRDVEAIVAHLAVQRSGHVALLLPAARPEVQVPLVEHWRPDVVLTAEGSWRPGPSGPMARHDWRGHEPPRHDLHPDLALVLATSGSTGSPKLVRLSHENLASNATAIAASLGLQRTDRAITPLPLHYCYGLSVLHSHLAVGASVVLSDLSVVDRCFWDLAERWQITNLAGVPHTFELLDRLPPDATALRSLRLVTQAGGRLSPSLVEGFARRGQDQGWDLVVMYGQTEATARMACLPPQLAIDRPTAIGHPIPGGSFRLDPLGEGLGDPTGADRVGEVGEVVYRGPNVMLGYAEAPADLAAGRTVTELRTGDLARRGDDGLYEIVGRRSRFVKPFGVRVDLDHLERTLARPTLEVAVTGDDRCVVVAVARSRPGSCGTTLAAARPAVDAELAAAAARIAAEAAGLAALPADAVVGVGLTELPRLASGKLDHRAVLALRPESSISAGPDAAGPAVDDRGDLASAVAGAYAVVLGREVGPEETFVSAGGDSLTYMELALRLEALLGTLPDSWHVTPRRDLVASSAKSTRRRRAASLEATVVLRAVSIIAIVGTHAGLWYLPGGAHVMLVIAGLNFARFQTAEGSTTRSRLRSLARVAAPSALWIAAVAAVGTTYEWPAAVFLHALMGGDDGAWGYWFVEVLVWLLAASIALLAIGPVARVARRHPMAVPLALGVAALAIRFGWTAIGSMSNPDARVQEVAWMFALGWAAGAARSWRGRALATAALAAGLWGFFGVPDRELRIAVGAAIAIWVPRVLVLRVLARPITLVAGASLGIYLAHWQLFPPLTRTIGTSWGVFATIAIATAVWTAGSCVVGRPRLSRPRTPELAPTSG